MERAGLHASEVAHQLGWSPSRVSRLLSGKRGCSPTDVMAFLTLSGVKGEERDRLMAIAKQANDTGWFQPHGARLPEQLITLIDHENEATSMTEFESTLVPGLLQTAHYARAVIHGVGTVPLEEIDPRVKARMERQSVLDQRRTSKCTFFIHEFVLRLPVGGHLVMWDQLHHLLQLSVRPNIILRVVPARTGVHSAVNGTFRFMEFAEIDPVIYLETETTSVFLESPIEVSAYRKIIARLADVALDEGQSKEMIGNLAVELYADREDHDVDDRSGVAEEQL
jgi:transcriptional regulator with XRE-family HTH domain